VKVEYLADNTHTDVGEEHRQEDEAVQCAEQHDAQVHTEVEHLEELRVREYEDEDAAELCQSDATQHLGTTSRHITHHSCCLKA